MAKLEPRHRKVKILATVGPASRDPAMLRRLLQAGADAFRVNMSHGDHAVHEQTIRDIRALEKEFSRPIAILCDLQGPKLRVGTFRQGERVVIRHGSHFTLDRNPEPGDETRVCLPHPELFGILEKGQRLLIDDGKIRLKVIRVQRQRDPHLGRSRRGDLRPQGRERARCGGAGGGDDRQGPRGSRLRGEARGGLDRAQLRPAARRHRRSAQADGRLRRALRQDRKAGGRDRLDEILELSDAVMVARGDLGVELNPEDVPSIQKRIVSAARSIGKPVIVATQMLESMIESPTPTRAEVSDVANAVYDGADAVMLSAETAAGQWPEEAVTMMNRIAQKIESDDSYARRIHFHETLPDPTTADALSHACMTIAETVPIAAVVVFTGSGSTARRVARERPATPVMVLTPSVNDRPAGGAAVGRLCGDHARYRQFRRDDRQGQAHGAAPQLRQGGIEADHPGRRAVRDARLDQPAACRLADRQRAQARGRGLILSLADFADLFQQRSAR